MAMEYRILWRNHATTIQPRSIQ